MSSDITRDYLLELVMGAPVRWGMKPPDSDDDVGQLIRELLAQVRRQSIMRKDLDHALALYEDGKLLMKDPWQISALWFSRLCQEAKRFRIEENRRNPSSTKAEEAMVDEREGWRRALPHVIETLREIAFGERLKTTQLMGLPAMARALRLDIEAFEGEGEAMANAHWKTRRTPLLGVVPADVSDPAADVAAIMAALDFCERVCDEGVGIISIPLQERYRGRYQDEAPPERFRRDLVSYCRDTLDMNVQPLQKSWRDMTDEDWQAAADIANTNP